MLNLLANNAIVILYALQAATYVTAAALLASSNHRALVRCYWASAILHGLLGASHVLQLG